MKKLIGANLKMNKSLIEMFSYLDQATQHSTSCSYSDILDFVIFPQQLLLSGISSSFKDKQYRLGAQNISTAVSGSHTGESSPLVLQEIGVSYVIVGHGERRRMYGEDDPTVIQAKLINAIEHGMRPILCIGETLAQYEANQTTWVLSEQLSILDGIDTSLIDFAYEPVWSIGTGKIPTMDEITSAHMIVKEKVSSSSRVIYGGSANETNCHQLVQLPCVDGFLVGTAALRRETFQVVLESLLPS